uniref:PTS sugar transporter subunit IIA n=1 Tax=Geoalkalibacter sp. TaxID=3041440 RepID=UPI00272E91A0
YRIEGTTREKVLADTVEHLRLPDEVDRDYLYRVLLAREKIASTAVGDGIALPHPRNPMLLHVTRPTVTLCFLEHPVDFGALDGRPVRILFTLISPTLRFHLHLLAKLAFALKNRAFHQIIQHEGSREEILTALRQAEEDLLR